MSETLSGLFNRESYIYYILLEKWFPLWGERAHSLNYFVCTIRGLRYKKKRGNNNLPNEIIYLGTESQISRYRV